VAKAASTAARHVLIGTVPAAFTVAPLLQIPPMKLRVHLFLVLMAPMLAAPVQAQTCVSEAGFSPEGSAAQLVNQVISSAQKSIRLAGYNFTSPTVVRRLTAAKRRGVDVAVLVDARSNLQDDRSGKSRAALNVLAQAGIPVRTVDAYPLHHDKYIVVDNATVETGSFNYTTSAARYNSENVLVLRHCPNIAQAYLDHWQSRWNQGQAWQAGY
jgi:phosphatidylserine/phosphatidylglycerophosphate/cardiolipin synthase-like enzyme